MLHKYDEILLLLLLLILILSLMLDLILIRPDGQIQYKDAI